ncbi:MAG: hypothetical protein KJ049_03675 [Gammaproteobacteria bacterium]|nr:hypothetical protein [Gammaproteobacteria bacterium]
MRLRLSWLGALLAVTIIAVAATMVALTWRETADELRDILDDDLASQSRLLARLLAAERLQLPAAELDTLLRRVFRPDEEDTLWVNVYDLADGSRASNLRHDLPLADVGSRAVRLQLDGHDWEGFQRREDSFVVQLLRRSDRYEEASADIVEEITLPIAIGGAVNLMLLGALLGLFLWPLARLVREIETRDADSLAPLQAPAVVAEIGVLRDTLNRLMVRVDHVLRRERQFASDIAHELRTPLTTLKLEMAAPEPDLAMISSEVDRVARLVEQLLILARVDQERWRETFRPVELGVLCTREIGRQARRMERLGITVAGEIAPATVAGEPALLQALLQNLLNNVADHCPAGTRVVVDVSRDNGRTVLEVRDNGPGLPDALREQLSRSITRLDSRSHGLGIGLAICQRIARAHGATLAFLQRADGTPGLRVRIEFPS